MMQNAHVLGQPRMPTSAEVKQMEKDNTTLAVLQIAGTAVSSMLESGEPLGGDEAVDISLAIAKDLLNKSEQTKDDYGEKIGRRKIRNQLAAQLLYSTLRGGADYRKDLIDWSFDIASNLLTKAEQYAEDEAEKSAPTSDIIAT
jgi:hypothetical protein